MDNTPPYLSALTVRWTGQIYETVNAYWDDDISLLVETGLPQSTAVGDDAVLYAPTGTRDIASATGTKADPFSLQIL
jgi:hypothetical protein